MNFACKQVHELSNVIIANAQRVGVTVNWLLQLNWRAQSEFTFPICAFLQNVRDNVFLDVSDLLNFFFFDPLLNVILLNFLNHFLDLFIIHAKFDSISHFLPGYCVLKVLYLYKHKKLKNAGTTHDKVEAIVWFKPAVSRIIPRANQLANLAKNVHGGQHNVHCDHQRKEHIRWEFLIYGRTFFPRDKNQDCHANCIDVVGHQNEIQLIGAGRCGYLRAVWHKKLAITHEERHKLGVKQRSDLLECYERVDARYFLVFVNIDRGIKCRLF